MVAQLSKEYIRIRPSKAITRLMSYCLYEGRPITTKGQWINPLISRFFEIEKKLPQLKKVRAPIFILGTGRSGTTILGLLLSMHKDVGFLNEPKAVWKSIYADDDLIGSYSQNPGRYRLSAVDADPEIINSAHKIYGAYLAAVCCNRLVDKYPELVFRVSFVRKIFPDAKFIFLMRNGWDTCHSIKKWSEQNRILKYGHIHDWWGVDNRKWNLLLDQIVRQDKCFSRIFGTVSSYKDHAKMALVEWIVTMREGLDQINKFGEFIMPVRYEDLIQNHRRVLGEILNFSKLEHDDKVFEYAKTVIKPPKPHRRFEIPSELNELFSDIMNKLGY